jgi:hypothetical protein
MVEGSAAAVVVAAAAAAGQDIVEVLHHQYSPGMV